MEFVSHAAFSRWKSTFILSRFPKREKEGESKSVRPLSNRRSTINGQPTLWTQSIVLMSPWTDIVAAKARAHVFRSSPVRDPRSRRISDDTMMITRPWSAVGRKIDIPLPSLGTMIARASSVPLEKNRGQWNNGNVAKIRDAKPWNKRFPFGGQRSMNFGEKDPEMERNSRREEGEEEEGKEFSEFCERRKKVRGSMSALKGARARAYASACLS